jgi:predicted small lipoprotein YifL
MKRVFTAAAIAAALCALAGCYIGKAEFKMRLSA